MRRMLLILALVLPCWLGSVTSNAVAQNQQAGRGGERVEAPEPEEEHELETHRDASTPATSTVGKSLTVVESSFSFIDNRDVPETHSFPELLVRYGICE